MTITFSAVAILLLWSLHRYVLEPYKVTLDVRRAGRTGLLALVVVGLCVPFTVATDPTLESTILAGLVLLVGALSLVEISGGRETWVALTHRGTGETADRS